MTTYTTAGARSMMRSPTRKQLVLDAAKRASRLRASLGISHSGALCAADVALRVGVEVRFRDVATTMEGFYLKEPKPLIVVSSLRPAGRQSFTVAHELGHHVYGHPGHVLAVDGDDGSANEDRRTSAGNDINEVLADAFAAHLLMPKLAVMGAFASRSLTCETAMPAEVYVIACWLGVGYKALVSHLYGSLSLISSEQRAFLSSLSPKKIRAFILGRDIAEDLIPVDTHWDGTRAVDAQVGDIILLPPGGRAEQKVGVTQDYEGP